MAQIGTDKNIRERVRDNAQNLIYQIVEYFGESNRAMNEIIIAPLSISARMIRTHDAITILLKEVHPSEAAILTLTQLELRLDLGYTASDVKHAGLWLDHLDNKWSVISMTKKLDALFKEAKERETIGRIFEKLSGIKHGNPFYSELGFPGRVIGKGVKVFTSDIDDDLSKRFTEALSDYATYQLSWSAQVLNSFTAQYAAIEKNLRLSTYDRFARLKTIEKSFLQFLQDITDNRKGHFGLTNLMKQETDSH